MRKLKIKKINKYYNMQYSKKFYNFAVKDNENYFVNSILTHNCYMSRYNGERVFVNTNVDDIFQSVVEWEKDYIKVPDHQDPIYTMVDIA